MQITNSSFICSSCGGMADIASILQLHANYGSAHDGTRLDLKLCGRYMDVLFNFIQQERKKERKKKGSTAMQPNELTEHLRKIGFRIPTNHSVGHNPETGEIFLINEKNGEVKGAHIGVFSDGSRTYTGDQINAYKEQQERKQRALHYKEERDKLGSFAFVSREYDTFSEVPCETVARLIYLSTFSHIGTGQLYTTQRTPMQRNMLQEVLNISRSTAYRFWDEVNGKFIAEQENGTLWIDPSAFVRGKLGRQGSFLKVYDNAVRNLYENSAMRNIKQIGYIFQMLPYLNIEHNVLCHDPYEMELKNVKLMTAKEFCAAIGYNYDNFHRLRKIYTHLCVEVDGHQERFCSFVSGGINDRQDYIFINPHVIYSGSNPNNVALLGKFSEISEASC